MFEYTELLGLSAEESAGVSDRVEQTDLAARFLNFVAAHGWTQQQAFKAAYRQVRRAINVHGADNDYRHYRQSNQIPAYVLAFMDGDFGAEGVWGDDY